MTERKSGARRFFPYASIIVFLLFAGFFIHFRRLIASLNISVLKVAGEYHQYQKRKPDEKPGKTRKKKKARRRRAKRKSAINHKKPVVKKLPKTDTPKIPLLSEAPTLQVMRNLPALPPLRKFSGEKWNKGKTEIHMALYDDTLFVDCLCHDPNPDQLITKYSKQSAKRAYKDDSVEFFLMRDRKASHYCQYVCSASGKGHVYYNKVDRSAPNKNQHVKKPKGFQNTLMDATRTDKGFRVHLEVPLSNIGLDDVGPDSTFLLQFARNYRGQGNKGSLTLHLFPTHIYADTRLGINNHDRRAFRPVDIVRK